MSLLERGEAPGGRVGGGRKGGEYIIADKTWPVWVCAYFAVQMFGCLSWTRAGVVMARQVWYIALERDERILVQKKKAGGYETDVCRYQ